MTANTNDTCPEASAIHPPFPTLFERSKAGRGCTVLKDESLFDSSEFSGCVRGKPAELPQVAEVDLIRHFIGLSRRNFGVDNGFYPLGSCTMKYNPKINDITSNLPGFTELHPYQEAEDCQGSLTLMRELSNWLSEIFGMHSFTLQPAAGAHGEFTGLLIIK